MPLLLILGLIVALLVYFYVVKRFRKPICRRPFDRRR